MVLDQMEMDLSASGLLALAVLRLPPILIFELCFQVLYTLVRSYALFFTKWEGLRRQPWERQKEVEVDRRGKGSNWHQSTGSHFEGEALMDINGTGYLLGKAS